MHPQGYAAGTRGEQRYIADKLQCIAETLFGLDVNVLSGEIFTLPWLFGKSRTLAFAGTQPPLVFIPAFTEIAAHQEQDAKAGSGIGVIWRQRDRPAQRHHAVVELSGIRLRSVVPRLAQASAKSELRVIAWR